MITNNDIRRFLQLKPVPRTIMVREVDAIGYFSPNTLSFVNESYKAFEDIVQCTSDCVYIADSSFEGIESEINDIIYVDNPKFLFCLIVDHFKLKSRLQNKFTLSKRSLKNYKKHKDNIYCKECWIGENLQVDKGAIIGGTDFSPVLGRTSDEILQFPQMGGVYIGDNVTIKYNSMIGKGTFGYTSIGDNTMIDYGCQIGHNCYIGDSCIIAAGTIIGGSTVVGSNTVIGIGAKIRNGITIGMGASIGMGSVVIKDVPPYSVVVGNPARVIEHKHIFDKGGLK